MNLLQMLWGEILSIIFKCKPYKKLKNQMIRGRTGAVYNTVHLPIIPTLPHENDVTVNDNCGNTSLLQATLPV